MVLDLCQVASVNIRSHPELAGATTEALARFLSEHLQNYIVNGIDMPIDELIGALIQVNESRLHIKPEPVISFCSECNRKSARLHCTQCKDLFCSDCFSVCHMLETRQMHSTEGVRQECCDKCDMRPAIYVVSPNLNRTIYCEICFRSEAEKSSIPRTRLSPLKCTICSDSPAELVCIECNDLTCGLCYHQSHYRGRMGEHHAGFISSDDRVWLAGRQLCDRESEELLESVVKKHAEQGVVAFFADDGSRYWFDFSRQVV